MKNKVDIDKLIEKKYKGNTLDLNDLLGEIDLVLQESDQSYLHSKIIPANLEENPESENIAFRMGQVGNRNSVSPEPGYSGKEPSEVIPDKLAEMGQQISKAQTVELDIPDIFSLVTNSRMDLKDSDRELINEIVQNIVPDGRGLNWKLRIGRINDVTTKIGSSSPDEWKGSITSAISNLMFLSLLMKLSYNISQPGKLFEYVIAPLIDPTARVVGGESENIADVIKSSRSSPGKSSGYSIKFLKSANMRLEGSRNLLQDYVKDRAYPITYIIAKVNEQKNTIQFAELLVSSKIEHFVGKEQNWQVTDNLPDGAFLQGTDKGNFPIFGIWVNEERGQTIQAALDAAKQNIPTGQSLKSTRGTSHSFDFLGNTFSVKDKTNGFLKVVTELKAINPKFMKEAILKYLPGIKNINNYNLLDNNDFLPIKDKILDAISIITQIHNNALAQTNVTNETYEEIARPEIEQIIKQLENYINDLTQNKATKSQQPQQQIAESKTIFFEKEKMPPEEDMKKFQISITGFWNNVRDKGLTLNLGKPEKYKQLQLTIANSVTGHIQETFKNYKELSTNIVGFFATDPRRTQDKNYGQNAIKNAESIKNNIDNIK
jgi:hypothetical protein